VTGCIPEDSAWRFRLKSQRRFQAHIVWEDLA
jgi:hypothetical protein